MVLCAYRKEQKGGGNTLQIKSEKTQGDKKKTGAQESKTQKRKNAKRSCCFRVTRVRPATWHVASGRPDGTWTVQIGRPASVSHLSPEPRRPIIFPMSFFLLAFLFFSSGFLLSCRLSRGPDRSIDRRGIDRSIGEGSIDRSRRIGRAPIWVLCLRD
jgi:hypothetical protein